MKIKWIIGLCFVLLNFTCCDYTKNKEKDIDSEDKLIGNKIELFALLDLKRFDNKALIIYFDGNCSSCVGETLVWLKKYNELSSTDGIDCYIISRSVDTYQIESYLEQMNIKLKKNHFLKADSNDLLMKNYPFLDTYRSILLINKENIILASIDPFKSKKVKKLYKEQGVLN